MAKIKGINVNGTDYDLDLSKLGIQTGIAFESPERQTGSNYSVYVNDERDIRINGNTNKYDDQIGSWLPTDQGSKLDYTEASTEVGGNYLTNLLKINSFYLGGPNSKTSHTGILKTLDADCAATHNFVELANASGSDIDLNGLYLLYIGGTMQKWEALKLKGFIKSGSTFLIKGMQVSMKTNTNVSVDEADMIWYITNEYGEKEPISFNQSNSTFYLAMADHDKIYDYSTESWVAPENFTKQSPYYTNPVPVGYIDSVGVGSDGYGEGGKVIKVDVASKVKNCIFFRQYTLDRGAKTVLKEWAKRSSAAFWTYCDFTQSSTDFAPYYTDNLKQGLKPMASWQGKNFFSNKNVFRSDVPNCINITFGKQATAGTGGADRCFNWISKGFYDEFVEYRKVDTQNWTKKHSIEKNGSYPYTTEYQGDDTVAAFIDVYDRYRWFSGNYDDVTTHKAIIRGLTSGTYEYRIGREGDASYISETKRFVVKTNSDVNTSFNFVHTSDQQSFNFNEYQAWTKASYCIGNNESFDFSINTGDMAQSGTRESEWIDYFNSRRYMDAVSPIEMPTIGNNDLCENILYGVNNGGGKTKFSSRSIWLYYNFDLDHQNSAYFHFIDNGLNAEKLGTDIVSYDESTHNITYFVPSMYSFNYGNYHFIALNSEYVTNIGSTHYIYDDSAYESQIKCNMYYQQYKWMENDFELYGSDKKCIVYAHEIPFCIVAIDTNLTPVSAKARTYDNGSKLNFNFASSANFKAQAGRTDDTETYNSGAYYSKFFQNNGIRLCLGGHKHTYSLSWPTVESDNDPAHPTVNTTSTKSGNTTMMTGAGTVYCMLQATGFKLSSNNDIPGVLTPNNTDWLFSGFPANAAGELNLGQEFPIYSTITCSSNDISLKSYRVSNVVSNNGSKYTAFDINAHSLYLEPQREPLVGTNDGNVYADIKIQLNPSN